MAENVVYFFRMLLACKRNNNHQKRQAVPDAAQLTARFQFDVYVDFIDGQSGIEAVVTDVQHLSKVVSCTS